MKDPKIMAGSTQAPQSMHITVTDNGPYLVYGAPPLAQQIITPNALGECMSYQQGTQFSTEQQPTALCRCGRSHNAPYCDSSHTSAHWDSKITAPVDSLIADADIIEGEGLTLVDNDKYCVYARFCHPQGGTWRLTEESADPEARDEAIRQASLCPSARLTAWGVDEENPYELKFEPSLGLLEDPSIGVSSGIWVRGGILIQKQNGESFEVRNRVVMCRCGGSHNKPFCDGSHARYKWNDGLSVESEVDVSEEVY